MPTCYLHMLIVRSLLWSLQAIFPKYCSPMVLTWCTIWCPPHIHACMAPCWMIFFHPICWFLHFIPDLPRPLKKGKLWSQYELGVAFSSTLYGPFVFHNNFWDIASFLIDFACFLTTTRYHVSNYLLILPLLHSYLCISLLSDTSMLNSYLCLNRSGCTLSNWSKSCCTFEVPSLVIAGGRSICKWVLSYNIHYWSSNVSSVYWACIPSVQCKEYLFQLLIKASFSPWVYVLYLFTVSMKPFISNFLVVAHYNFMYWY